MTGVQTCALPIYFSRRYMNSESTLCGLLRELFIELSNDESLNREYFRSILASSSKQESKRKEKFSGSLTSILLPRISQDFEQISMKKSARF